MKKVSWRRLGRAWRSHEGDVDHVAHGLTVGRGAMTISFLTAMSAWSWPSAESSPTSPKVSSMSLTRAVPAPTIHGGLAEPMIVRPWSRLGSRLLTHVGADGYVDGKTS